MWQRADSLAAQASPPRANDYSAVMAYMSDNNKTTALAQILAQEQMMQQASMDRQMQAAATLEMGLETLDTKLQIRKLDFFQNMTTEQNSHKEEIAKIGVDLQRLEGGGSSTAGADLPSPEEAASMVWG